MEVSGQLHVPAALPPGKENSVMSTKLEYQNYHLIESVITTPDRYSSILLWQLSSPLLSLLYCILLSFSSLENYIYGLEFFSHPHAWGKFILLAEK